VIEPKLLRNITRDFKHKTDSMSPFNQNSMILNVNSSTNTKQSKSVINVKPKVKLSIRENENMENEKGRENNIKQSQDEFADTLEKITIAHFKKTTNSEQNKQY